MSAKNKTFSDALSSRQATAEGTGVDSDMSVLSLHGHNSGYVDVGDFGGECISNPALCIQGLSVSFWMKHKGEKHVTDFTNIPASKTLKGSSFVITLLKSFSICPV